MTWAHQGCQRPLDLSEQWAIKIKLLKEQLAKLEKRLTTREEELKSNAIDLVAPDLRSWRRPKLRLGNLGKSSPSSVRKLGR